MWILSISAVNCDINCKDLSVEVTARTSTTKYAEISSVPYLVSQDTLVVQRTLSISKTKLDLIVISSSNSFRLCDGRPGNLLLEFELRVQPELLVLRVQINPLTDPPNEDDPN